MTGKFNIIMLNMSTMYERQQGIVNRNFFVLRELAGRPEVAKILAVDFLPTGMPGRYGSGIRMAAYYVRNFWLTRGDTIEFGLRDRVILVEPNFYNFSTLRSDGVLEKIAQLAGKYLNNGAENILWSYNPFLAEAFSRLPAKIKIFDAVDNWLANPIYKNSRAQLQEGYDKIKRQADLIFTVSPELVSFFGSRAGVYCVPNGVDIEMFAATSSVPRDLAQLERPIIGYVGNIQERLDTDLLKILAEKNPEKSFVLIGPIRPTMAAKLPRMKNIYYLGRKPYAEAVKYLQNFDIGIVPHRTDAFVKSMDPLKIYDYLAAGLPVVSTVPPNDSSLNQWVELASTPMEFHQKLNLALTQKDQRSQRQQAAQAHSWSNRMDKMWQYIWTYQS
ncbi:glycosyltransferase [Candidatus Uhrbacteria bacterium]|nr:glycosyltransferase [Candidatus Uhrbacteria bacterium]